MTKADSPADQGDRSGDERTGVAASMDPPRTPPAWDPLGVAPFAWDLPEPTPLPTAPVAAARGGAVINRVNMGLTLLTGGLAAAGIFAGWWSLSWAQVTAVALTVLALGLLVSALRGRGFALIGPGVFLSLLTLGLTITGLKGTDGFGEYRWTPTIGDVRSSYQVNAGQAELDLSQLTVPVGTVLPLSVDVHAGHAVVTLPKDTQVNVTCEANAGMIDCLGQQAQGLHSEATATQAGTAAHGTINLTVDLGAGYAQVRHG